MGFFKGSKSRSSDSKYSPPSLEVGDKSDSDDSLVIIGDVNTEIPPINEGNAEKSINLTAFSNTTAGKATAAIDESSFEKANVLTPKRKNYNKESLVSMNEIGTITERSSSYVDVTMKDVTSAEVDLTVDNGGMNDPVHHQNTQKLPSVDIDEAAITAYTLYHNNHEVSAFNLFLRFVTLVGGTGIMLLSAYDWCSSPFLSPAFVLSIYTFLFGLVICTIEFDSERVKSVLEEYAKVLTFSRGRGFLHILAGTLMLIRETFLNNVVGLYVVSIGVLSLLCGTGPSEG